MLCMAASMSSLTFAQSKVTGVVKDSSGEPIIGASVTVKGAQGLGTVTDIDGNFTLSLPSGKKQLLVTYIGFTPQTVDASGKNTFTIVLKEDNKTLNEVVVVGYGTMKKSDLAGATGSMDEKKMKTSIITNLDQSLGGRVAGVTSMATSGAPGSSTSIRVRGQATINAGAEPLYVVDGVIWNNSNTSGSSGRSWRRTRQRFGIYRLSAFFAQPVRYRQHGSAEGRFGYGYLRCARLKRRCAHHHEAR